MLPKMGTIHKIKDDILSYREMCDAENSQPLQRGMNFGLGSSYSVILMSQRPNAPYHDKVHSDGITIEYEGHDISKKSSNHDVKSEDQIGQFSSGVLTQNGKFSKSVEDYKNGVRAPELVKVYEKILPGVWSLKGLFDLVDYKIQPDGKRNTYRFILKLSNKKLVNLNAQETQQEHSRVIPTEVKKEVWKRDGGKCVMCGDIINLHFDHELPFSKGGTSLTAKNVRLLCMKHNLQKSAKIE